MKPAPERPKVLALGSGITLLGVIRILGESRADVVALTDSDRITRQSRWFRPAPTALSGLTADTLGERLEALSSPTVLMPCSDYWARAVAALPDEILARYPASIAPLEALDLLVDKARFRTALEQLSIPHPLTRLIASVEHLDEIPESAFQSSFLKPVQSQQFFARFGVKAFRVSGKREARKRLQSCLDAGLQMMLQEYVPGPPTNHYFIDGFMDRTGEVRALFARQRLRMNPPDFGNSTLMVSVPLADTGAAAESLTRLLHHISYRGIFSAEFKRDARGKVFNLIEVNGRPWWYVEFAARCGLNVCEMAVRDALCQPVATLSRYAVGRRCVFPYYDYGAVRAEIAAGRLGWVGWLRSWLGAYQPVFRWSDPLPAMRESVTLIAARIRRLATRS